MKENKIHTNITYLVLKSPTNSKGIVKGWHYNVENVCTSTLDLLTKYIESLKQV